MISSSCKSSPLTASHQGDTFYCYDLDRSSLSDFMLYQRRIFLHMVGVSSLRYFRLRGMHKQERLLARGCAIFWLAFPLPLLLLTRSPWFLCAVWLQPLCAMSFFLALVNWAFHAFIELDASGRHLPHVNALTILDGQDDNFGEDDHMAHHYENPIAHARSRHDAWRARIMPELKANRASIFKEISIVELGILTLLGQVRRFREDSERAPLPPIHPVRMCGCVGGDAADAPWGLRQSPPLLGLAGRPPSLPCASSSASPSGTMSTTLASCQLRRWPRCCDAAPAPRRARTRSTSPGRPRPRRRSSRRRRQRRTDGDPGCAPRGRLQARGCRAGTAPLGSGSAPPCATCI